ncbi:MAG: division/cell wall cluster transcriptional repressor MraZ [Parcubacteria group bacterium]|nr:division/cell wall cluster transcriptional repressor MraZ [Parcubacteria group bacterium]
MFIGEYNHTVDSKGRLSIPSKFRRKLKEGVVITRGLDSCLFLYPKSEWEKLATKLSQLSISQANNRAFTRLMLAGAWDVKLDKQGRVVVPDYLRKYAVLNKKTVIAGLFNRLEIWDVEKWNKYKEGTEKSSNEIAEALGEIGV